MTPYGATTHFEPEPMCAAEARRFVVGTLQDWGLQRFGDEAALCVAELATNAILHCRTPFTVSVRPIREGVRVDVQDDRPDRLPVPLPPDLDPLASGSTGRGLRLVSAMSSRWGYFTTEVAKTVWAELSDPPQAGFREPLVELAVGPTAEGGRIVRIVDLPVRAAIASGLQVDDLVREVQLDPARMSPDDLEIFYRLLERSASPRLVGRQEAFRAAGRGADRYTLELSVSPDELAAVGELVEILERMRERSNLDAVQTSAEVEAMRAWLPGEIAAQYQGREPSPFPGAALQAPLLQTPPGGEP